MKESEINEFEKNIEGWERGYSSEVAAVNERINNGKRCVGLREEVAKAFSDAKLSARGESAPESKPYAERLISK